MSDRPERNRPERMIRQDELDSLAHLTDEQISEQIGIMETNRRKLPLLRREQRRRALDTGKSSRSKSLKGDKLAK